MSISVKNFPHGQRHFYGYLLQKHSLVTEGPWMDVWGCDEARITLEGMAPGDEIVIYAANTVVAPLGAGTPLVNPDKPYKKD